MLFERLSWTAGAGTLVVVRGPNGAGKTTLLRALVGFHRVESGRVTGIVAPGWVGHADGTKAELTALENLEFHRSLNGNGVLGPGTALERVGLADRATVPCRALSAGQRRRVAIARLLVAHHPVWLLDEPTASLDAGGERMLHGLVDAHCADGGIAIVATHRAMESAARTVEVVLG